MVFRSALSNTKVCSGYERIPFCNFTTAFFTLLQNTELDHDTKRSLLSFSYKHVSDQVQKRYQKNDTGDYNHTYLKLFLVGGLQSLVKCLDID